MSIDNKRFDYGSYVNVDDFTIKIYLYFFIDEMQSMKGFKSIKITLYQSLTSCFLHQNGYL